MDLSTSYIKNNSISPENISFYHDYGYLIAENLVLQKEIAELKKETANIFRGGRGLIEGLVPVTDNEPEEDTLKKYVAIHFPHKISPVIRDFLSHEGIVNVLTSIASPNVK